MEIYCSFCRSFDVIEWDDGWICCECGREFNEHRKRFRIVI